MSDPSGRLRSMRKLHMPYLQIASAAYYIYAAEGPKGLTMRRLAAAIGVRASALYRHFPNKDAILDAVAGMAEQALTDEICPPRRLRRDESDPVAAMAERALDFAVAQPNMFQLIARRGPPRPGDRARVMRTEMQLAMTAGRIRRDDPEKAAAALWAHLCGLVSLRERGDLPPFGKGLREGWLSSADRLIHGLAEPQRFAAAA